MKMIIKDKDKKAKAILGLGIWILGLYLIGDPWQALGIYLCFLGHNLTDK